MLKTLFLLVFTTFFFLGCGNISNDDTKSCIDVQCKKNETCIEGVCELKAQDICENILCSGHGTCAVSNGLATCICDSGYYSDGMSCLKNDVVNTCDNIDCSGYGDCVISNNTALCVCDEGYHAEALNCVEDIVVDPCEGITCSNHGSCQNSGGLAVCLCDEGFHAENLNCIEELSNCEGVTCSGNGQCALSGDIAICVCKPGYHAEALECVKDVDVCENVTCSDKGVCAVSNNLAICVCNEGYHSDENLNCIKNVNPCENVTCSNKGTCLLSGDAAVCVCDDGYYPDGLNCEQENPCEGVVCDTWKTCSQGVCDLKANQCDINSDCVNEMICDSNHNCVNPVNPCENIICSGNGVCGEVNEAAVCICDEGYEADGLNCISKTNPCDGISCSNNGTCLLSGNTPVCVCDNGYHTEGLNCVEDVDFCEGITCGNNGNCVISNSEALCICNDGYSSNGLDCIENLDPCANINCGNGGNCAVSGNLAVCICPTGFHSEGLSCVQDVDNCENVDCSNNGTCLLSGDTAVCVCNDGFHSEGLSCVENIDPCESITCSNHGTCAVSGNNPLCVCELGFVADGTECVQVINQGELFITEFMANPSVVSDTNGEWIELYNASNRTLSLNNVTIVKNNVAKALSGEIAPNSYFVIAKSSESLVYYDLIVPFSTLANSGGVFSLKNNGVILHEVTYLDSIESKSWQLDVDSFELYSDFTNWCAGADEISINNSDLGTPGFDNNICATDLCDNVTCDNRGVCMSDATEYICLCEDGYTDLGGNSDNCGACDIGYHAEGDNCVIDADLCDGVTCDNRGTCFSDAIEYICICEDAYTDIDNADDCGACALGYVRDASNDCVLEALTISWCNVQSPLDFTSYLNASPSPVYGQVYIEGMTDTQVEANPNVVAQLGFTYQYWGTPFPVNSSDYDWVNADFNLKTFDNHEYSALFPTDDPDSFYYIYRFSVDNGLTWTYCDQDGMIESSPINPGTVVIENL